MNKYLLFLLFVSVSFCENNETIHQGEIIVSAPVTYVKLHSFGNLTHLTYDL